MNNPSALHDEKTFYSAFIRDLELCEKEVIIESPFITSTRMRIFIPIFQKLLAKGINIYVITKHPNDLENDLLRQQAQKEIRNFERIGVQALLCIGNHHRKLAMIDRTILWEGSLNILSQAYSREIMRRFDSKEIAVQTFNFLNFGKYI